MNNRFTWIVMFFLFNILIIIAQINQTDSLALVDLYNTTNGVEWSNSTNWLITPVSDWYGIEVENNRVTKIELSNNNLSGEISTSTGDISKLEILNLGNNNLTGSIPLEIGQLASLKFLYLLQNQLIGNFPSQIGNLDSMIRIRIYANQIENLPDLSTSNLFMTLTEFNVSYNHLSFEDLEPNVNILPTFIYNTQDSIGAIVDTNLIEDASITLSVETGGFSNNYQWLKNGTDIPGATLNTLFLNNLTLDDGGSYNCRVTNDIVDDLELYSRKNHINVFSATLKDSIALADLYHYTNGMEWDSSNNWLSGNISEWWGITTDNGRVIEINLSRNNLSGSIPVSIGFFDSLKILNLYRNDLSGELPASIGNLTQLTNLNLAFNSIEGMVPQAMGDLINLEYLYLYTNRLEDLPNLSTTPLTNSIEQFRIQNNRLTFEDIEPNINISPIFIYSPQDSIGARIDTILNTGESLEISALTPGSKNHYQWMHNGVDIPEADSCVYAIYYQGNEDDGSYICRIIDTLAQDLTLYTRTIYIGTQVSVNELNDIQVKTFTLYNSYPNPFNPATTISYQLFKSSNVNLTIYNSLGQKTATLISKKQNPGYYQIRWDASKSPSGIYFYQITVDANIKSGKMIYLK